MAQTVVIDITARFTDETSRGLGKAKQSSDKLGDSLRRTQQQADKLGKSKSELSLKDKATQVIEKVNKNLKSITSKVWDLTVKVLDKATAPIRGIFNLLKNPIVQAGAIIGVTIGVKDTIDTFGNFEQAMADVKSIIQNGKDYKEEDFKRLESKGMELGETTVFSATEAAQGMKYLAQNGWSPTAIENSMPAALDLSAAGQTDLATTTNILASTMSPFGLDANKDKDIAGHVADVFAATSSGTSTTIEQLGETMKYAAPIAKEFGMSIEDASGLAGIMANGGIRDSMAGTTIRSSLSRMANPTKGSQVWLDKLGLNFANSNGSMKDMSTIIKDVDKSFQGLEQQERIIVANEIFGQRAATGWLGVIGQGSQKVNDFADSLYNCDGAAKKMAETQLDTLQGSFKLVQSAAEGAKIRIGKRLAPTLKDLTKWIIDKIPYVEKYIGGGLDTVNQKIDETKKKIDKFTSTSEWKDADFFGKVSISWDNLIAEPFGQWWDSTGKQWFANKANGIGEGIGNGITNGLLVLLGFDVQGVAEDGISIGASFAKGFSKGFDGKKIGEAFLNAVKGVFKDAGTLLPGGEKASGTSGFSAALLGILGFKAGKAGYGMFKGASSIFGKGGNKFGLGFLMGKSVSTNTMNVAAAVVNISGGLGRQGLTGMTGNMVGTPPLLAGGSSAMAGKYIVTSSGGVVAGSTNSAITAGLANTGYALGSGASTVGGAAITGGISIAGGLFGALGIGAGLFDLLKGSEMSGKDKRDKYWQGATKIGMVGAGAAIGSVVPVVGTAVGALVGAGVGGIGVLAGGNKVGKLISDFTDGTRAIKMTSDALKNANEQIDYLSDKKNVTDNLISEYNKLNDKISEGNLSITERSNLEKQQKSVVENLRELYPEIISQYDVGQNKLSEQLNTIKKISDINSSMAMSELKISAEQSRLNIPTIKKQYGEIKEEEKGFNKNIDTFNTYNPKMQEFYEKFNDLNTKRNMQGIGFEEQQKYNKEIQNTIEEVKSWYSGLSGEQQNQLGSLGVTTDLGNFNNIDVFQQSYQLLAESYRDNLNAYSAQNDKLNELSDTYNQAYESEKRLAELELGMTLEEASASMDKLNDSQKDIFVKALDTIKKYKNELDLLPPEKIIEINTIHKNSFINEYNNDMKDGNISTVFSKIITGKYAQGGLITKPHVGLIGEAGPEVIIPLSGANKEQGINLWEQAGELLGTIPKHAKGGIFGNTVNLKNDSNNRNIIYTMLDDLRNNSESKDNESKNIVQNNNPITISLGGINFTFNGTGTMDKDNIMQIIREQMPEIADDVAQAIADKLKKLFPNMKAGII